MGQPRTTEYRWRSYRDDIHSPTKLRPASEPAAKGSAQNLDAWTPDDVLNRRLYCSGLLKDLQSILDSSTADLESRHRAEMTAAWEMDEDVLRGAVDSWDDEYPTKIDGRSARYKTPHPVTPTLSAMDALITEMQDCWFDNDLALQAMGWRPESRDVNVHIRDRGTVASKALEGGAPPPKSASGLREAFPDLFDGRIHSPGEGGVKRDEFDNLFDRILGRVGR